MFNSEIIKNLNDLELILYRYIKKLGFECFSNCTNLKEIVIEEIPSEAFWKCESLEKVNIPSGVKVINESAFTGCENLKEINIPDSVVEIKVSAFQYCTSLSNVRLSNIHG